MAYVDSLPKQEKERYVKKLNVLYGSDSNVVDPYMIDEEQWKDDVCLWPPIEFGDIYSYLIDTPGQFTKEKLKAYKSLDAFNYYIRYVSVLIELYFFKLKQM